MSKTCIIRRVVLLIWVAVASLILAGCSSLNTKEPVEPVSSAEATSVAPSQGKVQEDTPVYYDFGDVMLPKALKINKKDSFVFHSPGMTAGVLVLSGSVDANSLFTFFESKMPVDGWQQVSSFKAARSMMLFQKDARWCVISITDGNFSTQVKLWVAPSIEHAARGLKK